MVNHVIIAFPHSRSFWFSNLPLAHCGLFKRSHWLATANMGSNIEYNYSYNLQAIKLLHCFKGFIFYLNFTFVRSNFRIDLLILIKILSVVFVQWNIHFDWGIYPSFLTISQMFFSSLLFFFLLLFFKRRYV